MLSGYIPTEGQYTSVVLRNRPLKFPYDLRVGSKVIPRHVINSLVNTMVYSTNYVEASKYKDIWAPYKNIPLEPTPLPAPPSSKRRSSASRSRKPLQKKRKKRSRRERAKGRKKHRSKVRAASSVKRRQRSRSRSRSRR